MPTRRERVRAATVEEIKKAAWDQIGRDGAAALSLRAISAALGMTGPALFRYFASRDALVTQLIADAYVSLAEALETARDAFPPTNHAGRFEALGMAYREWAIANPERYSLVFLTPLPGYEPNPEIVQPGADRALGTIAGVLEVAHQAGRMHPIDRYVRLTPRLKLQLRRWIRSSKGKLTPHVLYLALVAWTRVHGIVSLELYQPFPPIVEPDLIYRVEIKALLQQMGLG